ncbi:hypothetical protein CBL_20550 [Carabus blaptoides fortunei]
MANNESSSDNERPKSLDFKCEKCNKKVKTGVQCAECESSYHMRKSLIHGGVLILHKEYLNCETISDVFSNFSEELHFECAGIQMKIRGGEKIIVIAVYRTPKGEFNVIIKRLDGMFIIY